MLVEYYHLGNLLEANKWSLLDNRELTPELLMEIETENRGKYGYDVMIGCTCYNIKHASFADNCTKIKVKLTTKMDTLKEKEC